MKKIFQINLAEKHFENLLRGETAVISTKDNESDIVVRISLRGIGLNTLEEAVAEAKTKALEGDKL